MSESASQLLASFESLPANEQHELLVAILQRSGELPDAILADEHLVFLADELFQTLDSNEVEDEDGRPG